MLEQLKVKPGTTPNLAGIDATSTPGVPGDSVETGAVTAVQLARIEELQERLYAERRHGLVVLLQGLDCAGKDGTIRHVIRGMNPAGTKVASFKPPTDEELAHDFLWRVHARTPGVGEIAVFNRSHYEDVTTVRVRGLAPEKVWRNRFAAINAFEETLHHERTPVLKCFLHVSKKEQARRMRERADDPKKRWKLTVDDVVDHQRYDDYLAAYEEAIARTSTAHSPWWVVPADHKWYRNWAVAELLLQALEQLDPHYPTLDRLPEADQLG